MRGHCDLRAIRQSHFVIGRKFLDETKVSQRPSFNPEEMPRSSVENFIHLNSARWFQSGTLRECCPRFNASRPWECRKMSFHNRAFRVASRFSARENTAQCIAASSSFAL